MQPDLAALGKWSIRRMGLVIVFFDGESEPCKNASASAGVISRLADFASDADGSVVVLSVFAGCSAAERDVNRIAEAEVSGESANVLVEVLAEAGSVAGAIRIETMIPKLALTMISVSGFVFKKRTSADVLLGEPAAFKRKLWRRESLWLLVLSMELLCRGSMMTFEGNRWVQPS